MKVSNIIAIISLGVVCLLMLYQVFVYSAILIGGEPLVTFGFLQSFAWLSLVQPVAYAYLFIWLAIKLIKIERKLDSPSSSQKL